MPHNTPSHVEHPSPQRYRVGWLRQLIGLFAAPTLWAMQMSGSGILASYACYPHQSPLAEPQWRWIRIALAGVCLTAFLGGLFSARIAWNSWRRSRHEEEGEKKRTLEVGEGRTRFLALVSAYSSALFLIAIIFTAFALLLVAPCH